MDILDTPSSNLLSYLPRVTNFIKTALEIDGGVVYVHCVHGQSRSCAVCIAYLIDRSIRQCADEDNCRHDKKEDLKTDDECLESRSGLHHLELLHFYHETVRRARPCMAVNPGFVRQLEIFRQMKSFQQTHMQRQTQTIVRGIKTKSMMLLSKPHATFRCYRATAEFYDKGSVSKFCPLVLDYHDKVFVCKKCTRHLFTEANVIHDWSEHFLDALPKSDYWIDSSGGKEYIVACRSGSQTNRMYSNSEFENCLKDGGKNVFKVEPMKWMCQSMDDSNGNMKSNGAILCPGCKQKIGYWDWCRYHADPATSIILLRSKIDWRSTQV